MGDKNADSQETLRRWLARAQDEEGMSDGVLQKRTFARTAWSAQIEVRDGKGVKVHGRIRDVTEQGLGIQCRQRMANWTDVRIHLQDEPDEYLDGVVVHCTQTVGGFKIGVRLR